MPSDPTAPAEEVSAAKLLEDLNAARAHNDAIKVKKDEASKLREIAERELADSKRLNAEADAIRIQAEAMLERVAAMFRRRDELGQEATLTAGKAERIEAATAALVPVNEVEITSRIADCDRINAGVRANKARIKAQQDATAALAKVDGFTAQIEQLDAEKAAALAAAKLPVPGLAFTPDGVTLNGLPIAQASSAEQLRVSVAMGLALNPKLRVLLIRDGSLLDDNSLKLVAEQAAAADAQVWIERVGKGDECSVIIEDGNVLGQSPAEESPTLNLNNNV